MEQIELHLLWRRTFHWGPEQHGVGEPKGHLVQPSGQSSSSQDNNPDSTLETNRSRLGQCLDGRLPGNSMYTIYDARMQTEQKNEQSTHSIALVERAGVMKIERFSEQEDH